uniref:Uncharacterized protein n=1 Tax=Octopus bimaculoides TaxID=37653 RepID=A0A0L8HA29_OCTBM
MSPALTHAFFFDLSFSVVFLFFSFCFLPSIGRFDSLLIHLIPLYTHIYIYIHIQLCFIHSFSI